MCSPSFLDGSDDVIDPSHMRVELFGYVNTAQLIRNRPSHLNFGCLFPPEKQTNNSVAKYFQEREEEDFRREELFIERRTLCGAEKVNSRLLGKRHGKVSKGKVSVKRNSKDIGGILWLL